MYLKSAKKKNLLILAEELTYADFLCYLRGYLALLVLILEGEWLSSLPKDNGHG